MPGVLYQCLFLPFGLHGAPAWFQRMMGPILKLHKPYALAYLDIVDMFNLDWDSHLQKIHL